MEATVQTITIEVQEMRTLMHRIRRPIPVKPTTRSKKVRQIQLFRGARKIEFRHLRLSKSEGISKLRAGIAKAP